MRNEKKKRNSNIVVVFGSWSLTQLTFSIDFVDFAEKGAFYYIFNESRFKAI